MKNSSLLTKVMAKRKKTAKGKKTRDVALDITDEALEKRPPVDETQVRIDSNLKPLHDKITLSRNLISGLVIGCTAIIIACILVLVHFVKPSISPILFGAAVFIMSVVAKGAHSLLKLF